MKLALADRRDFPVLALLSVLAVYHISLLGSGALAWPDEHLYKYALEAASSVASFDLRGFGAAVGGWGARPLEVLLRSVPASIQRGLEMRWGLSPYSPDSLRIATAPNAVTSFLLSLVFYRVSLRLLGSHGLAGAATVVFSLLASFNVWVRHVLPYDTSLLLCLLSLLFALRLPPPQPLTARPVRILVIAGACAIAAIAGYPLAFRISRAAALQAAIVAAASCLGAIAIILKSVPGAATRLSLVAGVLGGLALGAYPAYYAFHAGVSAFILLGGASPAILGVTRDRALCASVHLLGMAAVVFCFESITRLGDVSYLGGARLLSQTITQGSFEEGYVFLPKLLSSVEGPVGVLLLVLAALFPIARVLASRGSTLSDAGAALVRIGLIFLALYLVYATQSAVLHKMTFTGRYARIYVPFVIWSAVGAISCLKRPLQHAALAVLLAASLYSFGDFVKGYAGITYPADALYRLGIGFEDLLPENIVYEAEIIPNYTLPVKAMTAGADYRTYPNDPRFAIVNFGIFAPEGRELGPYRPAPGAALLYSRQHFLTFRTSVFEGYAIWKREELLRRAYTLRVYRLSSVP